MIDDADKFLDEFLGNQPKTPKTPTTAPVPKLQPMKKPKADINSKIDQYSSQSGVDPNFVRAVMGQESGGNPNAKSWANAKGLLQIIPETGKKYRKDFDPFNVDHNLEVGTKHLAYLEKKYKGDKKRVLAAYNAGEGNADKENWYEQSQRWSNDPAVQKGLKPRGPSDKTNTRNYIDKIMRNYERMGGTQSAEDTFLDSFLGTPTEQGPIQGGTVSPAEIEFATPENLKKYGFEMPQTAPTPTVQGTQAVKQPSSVPTILRPNYPEQIAPKPGQLVLGGQDGEQLVQDDDQANVTQGEIRVKDKTGKKFLARQTKDKGYSVTPEVQYSNEDVEAGYSEYLGFTKEADTPETKQKYLNAIKGNVTTGTVEGYSGQMQPASAQAGLTQKVNDNYAKQVEQERSTAPAYYFTHPAEQKVKEIKTDADFLQTVAANVAIDISNKPSGMNLGEYLLRTALKANQPKYGYSDEGIERAVQATKEKTGKFTVTPYPDFTDDEFPEAVNQFKRQYESRYVNMGLTRGIINDALGGNDKQVADALAIEKPQVVKEIQNPFVLPNSVNRLTEEEARQKTIEEIKNPKLSTQFERAAKDAATKGFSQLKGLVTPFLLIPQMIDEIKSQYSNVVGTVPEESERIASELAKKKATFGSFADYQQIQQTRQEMDTGEYAVRLGAEVVRGATRLMVADSLKGLEVVGDFAEDLNPLSYILPDEYQPSIRNLGNLIGFTYARIQNPNLKYSDMPGMDSSIDKRLFYNIGKSVDEALGDDKYLRDTFGGALAQGMGSAAGFLLMGMVAPQAAIGARFSLSSAALGGLTSMGSGYSEARENGLTETQSKTYAFIMGLTGASEGFGVGSAVSRSIKNASLRKMFLYDLASYIKARGKNFADEGLEEFAQEFFQSTAGASSLAAIKDKEPDAYQRILNIFNRLPKQMGDAAVDAGSVAFLTGGLMGSTAGAIADRGRSNEGFRINEKSRRIEIEGVVMDYAPSLDPTIKSWKKSVEAMEDAYAEVGTLKNAIKNAKTPEAKVDAVRRLLALEKEVQGLSDQSARLLHRISSNVVPVEGQELKPVFDPEIDTVAPEVQVSTPEVTTEPVAIPKDEVAPVEVAAEAPEITEAKPIEPTVKPTTPKTPKTPKPEVLTEPAVSPSGTPKAKTGKVNRVIIEPKVNIAIQSETGEARSGTNPNGSTWTEVTTTKEDGLVVTKYNTVKPSGTKLNTGVRVTTVDDLLKEFPVIAESVEELEEFRKKYGEEVEIREVRDMAGRGAIDIVLTGKEKYTDYKMSVIFNRNDVQPKTETKPPVVPMPKAATPAASSVSKPTVFGTSPNSNGSFSIKDKSEAGATVFALTRNQNGSYSVNIDEASRLTVNTYPESMLGPLFDNAALYGAANTVITPATVRQEGGKMVLVEKGKIEFTETKPAPKTETKPAVVPTPKVKTEAVQAEEAKVSEVPAPLSNTEAVNAANKKIEAAQQEIAKLEQLQDDEQSLDKPDKEYLESIRKEILNQQEAINDAGLSIEKAKNPEKFARDGFREALLELSAKKDADWEQFELEVDRLEALYKKNGSISRLDVIKTQFGRLSMISSGNAKDFLTENPVEGIKILREAVKAKTETKPAVAPTPNTQPEKSSPEKAKDVSATETVKPEAEAVKVWDRAKTERLIKQSPIANFDEFVTDTINQYVPSLIQSFQDKLTPQQLAEQLKTQFDLNTPKNMLAYQSLMNADPSLQISKSAKGVIVRGRNTGNKIQSVVESKPNVQDISALQSKEDQQFNAQVSFRADDEASRLIGDIVNSGDDQAKLDRLKEIGQTYGVSEKSVNEVIERARQQKQKDDRATRTTDIIRETRSPKGATLEGKATTVQIPNSEKRYQAKFVVREASDVFPSHNPQTFQPNPNYYFVNDRHYDKEPQYQQQVIERSRSGQFNPNLVVNNSPTVETGVPVIDAEGNVLGGNSRTMIISRVYSSENTRSAEEYKTLLISDASIYGIDPAELTKFRQPILVRELSDASIVPQEAITDLNKTSTTDLTTKERAVAEAKNLSETAVDYITAKIELAGADASLTEALNQSGTAIIQKLVEEGIFAAGERNTLIDDGKITEDGKKRIERLLIGKVFSDLEQLELVAPSIKNVVTRIIAPLMKTSADAEWNILGDVREAIDLLNEAKAVGMGTKVQDFADQPSFLRPQGWTPESVAIAQKLSEGLRKAAQTFKDYAEDLRLAQYGSNAMFDMGAKSQPEAFKDAFGVTPSPKTEVPQTEESSQKVTPETAVSPTETQTADVETKFLQTPKTVLRAIGDNRPFFAVAPNGLKPRQIKINENVILAGTVAGSSVKRLADEARKLGVSDETHTIYQVVPKENFAHEYSIDDNTKTVTRKTVATKPQESPTPEVVDVAEEATPAEPANIITDSGVMLKSVADIDATGITLDRNAKGEILAPNGKVSNIQNEGLAKKIRTPEFIEWFGDSQVVDENGEPLMLFSGHGNLELYGDRYQPKKGTAGAFYATESQDVASSYSIGKMGNMEEYEQGSQYLFKQKNGKFAKKISQIEFTPEQQKIADDHIRSLGYDIAEYWKDNRPYDADARRALARGGLRNAQSIFIFLENMGENIWYADHQDARPMFQKQDKSEFEKILDKTGIEWQSRERSQPGVFPIFLSVQNPLDAAKPFPADLLKALQKKAIRSRDQFGSDGTQWTKDYPMKEWVERIESGDEYWTTQIPAKALEIIREFGYDGVKELGNKGESDRNKRQVNWLAFEPNQIKSIFNEGTFSGDNDSILKKVADTEARTEQERLQSVPLSELLDGQASFDGNNVELDIKAAENLRRHMAELSFRQKGKEVDESAFDGILAPKSAMNNIVELLQETYDTISLPEYGYSPEEIAGHKSLLDAMKQVAADQDFGVFYVFEEALPEELFHKEDFMSGRTDAKALTAISESKLWNIANAKGSKFNRHYGKQSAANRLSELVAKLATGQEEKYGFADAFDSREEFEDARDNLLIEWAEGILRNNPEIDLSKFERINKYVEAAENKRRSSDQPSIGEDIGSGQTGTGQQGSSQKSNQQSDSRAESQDEAEDGEVKLRVPKYAEKSLDTDEITYEQESMKTTKAKGEALRRMQGIDSILEQIRAATGDLPAMMSALYQEQTRLNDLADQFAEEGKMAEKDAVLEQLASLSSDIVSAQIQSGRAVNIAKTLEPLSAENALNVITRLKQRFTGNENEGLSAKGVQEIKNIQSELSDTNAKLKRATRKVDKLREQIKTGVSQSRKSSGNRVRRVTQVQKTINEKLNANYQDLLAQLKLDIDQEIMKMVADVPQDFGKWKRKNVTYRGSRTDIYNPAGNGAGAMLGRGLYTAPSSNKQMAKEYGKVYRVINGRPSAPLVFSTLNQWQIWKQQNLDAPFGGLRKFNEQTTIEAEMLKMGYDGIEIKGREIVNFTPVDVTFFETDAEVESYFYNQISQSAGSILKSVTDDAKLPEDAKEAIANIGAKILNDGLMSDTEFDDKEFAKAIEKVFTKNYAPFTDEIIAMSFDRLIEVRAEALKERMIAQMVEDGMSETEAKAETDKKLAEKKASAKTRAQSIASIRKIANRFRRHKATVDAFEDKTDNADVIHAGIILTEMKPLSMNVLITMLQRELSLTPDRALQVAKEAKKLQDEIAADKKTARDEARGMLPDALEEERNTRQAQQVATRRMNDVLRAVTDDANLMKRFNNDFRAKLVLNHATQLFNAVQSVLPVAGTMSGEIYTDAWDTAIRAISRKMGRESELDGIAPNVGPVTMLMPYGYLFSNNRQLAEGILAAFPDDYFRMELGILPDVNLDVTEVRGSNFVSKGLHKWFDKNQQLNEFLANITFAKKQEAHFRSLTFVATLDQLARNKGTTLKELLETQRPEEAFTEAQIRYAVDKALRVTFAEQMDDRIGRSLKRSYDQLDHYLPVLLNPFVYARFTYTVSRAVINAHTFGVLDSESLGGPGYNTRSTAKGFYGLTAIGIGYALLAAFGGDDDKWHHLYINGKENPPIDIRRFFPFSAYVYTAYLIKRKMEGRDVLARETLGTTFAELAESYASFDPDQYGRSPGVGVITSLGSDTEGATLKASAKLLGNSISGMLRFFRPIKMLTAQIDQDEASFRNYDKTAQDAFVGQLANNLPFISSMYNADKRTNPITGEALTEVMPLGKMVGLNFVNPMFVAPKPTPATEQAKTLFPYSGPSSEMTPEEREAYTIRREFKEAVRKGEKTLADLEPMIQKYTESGKLSARSAQILRKSLLASDLIEILKARFSFGDEKDVKKIRRVWDKANPLEQTELTALLKAKRDTARKNKDGKALQRAVDLLKELGIK